MKCYYCKSKDVIGLRGEEDSVINGCYSYGFMVFICQKCYNKKEKEYKEKGLFD
jgi:hypothetical protein